MPIIFHINNIANIVLLLPAILFSLNKIQRLKVTSATYNARLLPFAYHLLTIWILSILINIVSIIIRFQYSFEFIPFWETIFIWIDLIQITLSILALKSIYSKKSSKLSLTLFFLTGVSGSYVFVLYYFNRSFFEFQTAYYFFDSFAWASIYFAFVPAIKKLRLGNFYIVVFILAGLLSLWWLIDFQASDFTLTIRLIASPLIQAGALICWVKMIDRFLQKAEQSYAIAVKEIEDLPTSLNFATPFAVMISSTMEDLVQERNAADKAIRSLHLTRFRAETFGSQPHTPRMICEYMAQKCDLFILLFGQRYGYVLEAENISVVQLEYQIARNQNPRKILVYVKKNVEHETGLEEFLRVVEDFESGYFRTYFETPEELYEQIHRDIARWLVARATSQPNEVNKH